MVRFLYVKKDNGFYIPEISIKMIECENWQDGKHYVVYYVDEKDELKNVDVGTTLEFSTFENK